MPASTEDARLLLGGGPESANIVRGIDNDAYRGRVRFGLLGPTEVTDDGRGPVAVGGAVQRRYGGEKVAQAQRSQDQQRWAGCDHGVTPLVKCLKHGSRL